MMWKNFFRNKNQLFNLWEDLLKNPDDPTCYKKLASVYKKIGMEEQSKVIEELYCDSKREVNNLPGS